MSDLLVEATACTWTHQRLIWYGVCTHADALQVEFWQRKVSPAPPRGRSRTLKVSAEYQIVGVSKQCDSRRGMLCVIVTAECKSWCTGHKQSWQNKCKWSGRCDGCSECLGSYISWQAQVKETEVPEADGCNNKTDGSHDCEQHSQLSGKVVNAVTNGSVCIRVNVLASAFVWVLVLGLGFQWCWY